MSIKGSLERRELRQKSALVRKEARSKLSSQQQLGQLDKLFGEGKGATKERLRLHEQLKKS